MDKHTLVACEIYEGVQKRIVLGIVEAIGSFVIVRSIFPSNTRGTTLLTYPDQLTPLGVIREGESPEEIVERHCRNIILFLIQGIGRMPT